MDCVCVPLLVTDSYPEELEEGIEPRQGLEVKTPLPLIAVRLPI